MALTPVPGTGIGHGQQNRNWYQKWGCGCDKSDHVVLGPLKLVCGRTVKEFGASPQAPGTNRGAAGFGGFPDVFVSDYSLLYALIFILG